MKRSLFTFIAALVLLAPARADEEAPPTPKERIAALYADRADERADLGKWAAGKKMGLEGRAWLKAAIRLDPDCRTARVKLGHRKDGDGGWKTDRERELRDKPSAREKYGEKFAEREAEVVREEARAFADLGLALREEGHGDLAKGLLLHALFLTPGNEDVVRGLGLVPIGHGFGPEELAKEIADEPRPKSRDDRFLGRITGAPTDVRECGPITAEVAGNASAASDLARMGRMAFLLTFRRFTDQTPFKDWAWLAMAGSPGQYSGFLAGIGMPENRRALCEAVGTFRFFSPRHCIGSWYQPGMDAVGSGGPPLLHMLAEDVIFARMGENTPTWFMEAAGIEGYYAVSGQPGHACLTFEQSQGLVTKEAFQDVAGWPALLVRRAALDDLPRLELLRTAQIQALSAEDVIASHAYYRYLLLTRPQGFPKYADAMAAGAEELEAFERAFGATHEEITTELKATVLGR